MNQTKSERPKKVYIALNRFLRIVCVADSRKAAYNYKNWAPGYLPDYPVQIKEFEIKTDTT